MTERDALAKLIDLAGVTQSRAAELIAEQTMRPCSVRAIRSWLADENLPSARPVPAWAVKAFTIKAKAEGLLDAPLGAVGAPSTPIRARASGSIAAPASSKKTNEKRRAPRKPAVKPAKKQALRRTAAAAAAAQPNWPRPRTARHQKS